MKHGNFLRSRPLRQASALNLKIWWNYCHRLIYNLRWGLIQLNNHFLWEATMNSHILRELQNRRLKVSPRKKIQKRDDCLPQ